MNWSKIKHETCDPYQQYSKYIHTYIDVYMCVCVYALVKNQTCDPYRQHSKYIHTYIDVYMRVYVCVCARIYIYTYIHTYIGSRQNKFSATRGLRVHTHVHICIHTYIHTYIQWFNANKILSDERLRAVPKIVIAQEQVCIRVCMYVRMYVCVYVCMRVGTCSENSFCIGAGMYTCMYVCMYVYMYVCMWVHVPKIVIA